MKRLHDYDEFQQGIPRNKKMADLETGRLHVVGVNYVKLEDFLEMQEDLKNQLEEQKTVLEQLLIVLRQANLHLASMSDANVEAGDGED